MINVEDLRFSYRNAKHETIRKISFSIQKGEIFGFLGPSGAGKTTTQKLITGLLKGYQGKIDVLGKPRNEWGGDFFEEIGVAFEFPNLCLKLTAYENLELFAAYYKRKTIDLVSLLKSVGLEEHKDKKVEEFSKGMKVRLNFIRAIEHKPSILFLDEPTSGLDPVNADLIKKYIKEIKAKGKTVFLTTHNMTVAEQICDRVAFIVDGKLEAIDSPKKLMLEYGKRELAVEYFKNGNPGKSYFKLDAIGENKEFFKLLNTHEIKTIHTSEATLEDIFIKVTGRKIV